MKANEMVWENPPNYEDPSIPVWTRRLTPLIQHPKRWARFNSFKTAGSAGVIAAQLKNGKIRRPDGKWEFLSRTLTNGKTKSHCVYARYHGPKGAVQAK